VHVTFVGGAMADAPRDVRFRRSGEIAGLVWREYGRSAGVDTVSVRIHSAPPARHVGTAFFYPEQLGR
jgi:hypothetical protein